MVIVLSCMGKKMISQSRREASFKITSYASVLIRKNKHAGKNAWLGDSPFWKGWRRRYKHCTVLSGRASRGFPVGFDVSRSL